MPLAFAMAATFAAMVAEFEPAGKSFLAIVVRVSPESTVYFLTTGAGVGEVVGEGLGDGVGDGFGLTVGVGVGFAVAVGFGVGVNVGFGVEVGVGFEVGFGVGVGFGVAVALGLAVGTTAGRLMGLAAVFLIGAPVGKSFAKARLTLIAAGPLPLSLAYWALPVSARFCLPITNQ